MYDLVVSNARLYPMNGDTRPAAQDGFAVQDGRIVELGARGAARRKFDAGGRVVMPGLVDCHTHLCFAGDRMDEHLQRLDGVSYAEIARAGGGILSTVRAIRDASESRLVEESLPRLSALAREGVTSVEIKSGYGLDTEQELKMLRAIAQLRRRSGLDVTATFLGAHAVPPGIDKTGYVRQIVDEMLPTVAAEQLADCVDIYVEGIAFDLEDMRLVFEAASGMGLKLRAHTEQLSAMGGTAHAARLGALSADHLEYAGADDVEAMAAAGTVAVLLPGAFYFLRETQRPPVAAMRSAGVPIAVASDLNPGTSPVASLLTCMHMACTLLGLTAAEALLGATLNGARAMGRDRDCGSLEPGKLANFCVWDLDDPHRLVYQLGGLRPDAIFVRGEQHEFQAT